MLPAVVSHGYHTSIKPDTAPTRVTERQLEILSWLADGKGPWEIAIILGLHRQTVYFHLQKVLVVMDCVTVTQAVAKAIRIGLI